MGETAKQIIEYVAIPSFLIIVNLVVQLSLERAQRKREAKSDPGCFTVRMPVIFTISLITAFIVFTVIAVFFTRQVIAQSTEGIPWSQILTGDIGIGALDILCLVYAYMFMRQKVEINGDTAKVTPAFSKRYTFNVLDVTDVQYTNDKTKIKAVGRKLSVYRICYCYNMFGQWLGY
ncbi:MAG: hypothetical protein K2O89_03850 [Clostridia bacterium]|nr:hypothetical protein [Clostridia bacterium]